MSRSEIEYLLQPEIRSQGFALKFLVWIYIIVLAATAGLNGYNVFQYQGNGSMIALQSVLGLVCLSFILYGLYLFHSLRRAEQLDKSVLAIVKERLFLFRTKYNVWFVIIGLSIVLLTFAVNTWSDNENGTYTINKPGIFILFTLFQFAFVYVINRIAHHPYIQQMKAAIHDLENQVSEQTPLVRQQRQTVTKWMIFSAIIGLILFIWGLLRYLHS